MSADPDAEILTLEADFNVAHDLLNSTADRIDELHTLFQKTGHRHFHDDMRDVELKQDKQIMAASAIASKILHTRAHTPAGIIVKLRVNETWPGTYEDNEIFASISADLEAHRGSIAMTTSPDAELLRIEKKVNAASDRWKEASDQTAKLEEEENRLRSRRERAEKKEDKRSEAFVRVRDRVLETRAKSLDGLMVKVRVRELDYCDDPDLEVDFLKSLVEDIKAIGKAR